MTSTCCLQGKDVEPEIKEEMSYPVSDAHLGDFASAVTTYKGNIYTTWLDPDHSTMVAKKSSDGKVTVTKIPHSEAPGDPYHDSASLGIDEDGYIHVVSGMHYNGSRYYDADWRYWVSSKPEDISEFTFLGADIDRKPPWKLVSYPNFVNDRKGVLYLCYRIKASPEVYWKGGVDAGCVARYDHLRKSWTMLGGKNWELRGKNARSNPVGTKVLVWTDKDPEVDGYEGYKPTMAVDKNNRLHFTALGQAEGNLGNKYPKSTGTHAFYAYSDDQGETWYRANGTKIEKLPMTKETGDNALGSGGWPEGVHAIWNQTLVGFGSDLKPIVSYSFMGKPGKTWSRWDGKSWERMPNPLGFLGHFVTDDDGVITGVSAGKLMRSTDNGKTWKSYKMNTGNNTSLSFDMRYLQETKQIRYQCMSIDKGSKTGTMKVFTVKF